MSAELTFTAATEATEPGLRRLLRENPVVGEIRVSLEREPNAFHAAAVSGDDWQMMLAMRNDDVIGSGGRFELKAYVNGEPQCIGYFGELRAEGGLRARRKLLLGSYRKMHEFHNAGDVLFYLTTIVADNRPARRLLEAGLGDMPTYRPLEDLVTFTIPTRLGARRRGAPASNAATRHVGNVVALLESNGRGYQFHPAWTPATLASKERCRGLSPNDFIVCGDGDRGCLALWDQRAFKQTVIRGYAQRLARLRPLYNLAAPLVGRPRLPAPGARLENAFLSHVAVVDDDADTLVGLVARGCQLAMERGIDYVMLAFAARNPLAGIVRRSFPCHEYVSVMYAVFWQDGEQAVDALDDRIPHPEVAIL